MSDLAAFLRARLDEDEAAANEAARLPGARWDASDGGDGRPLDGILWDEDRANVIGWLDGDLAAAIHAARHDPARVLREAEAKRAILDRYERWDEGYGFQSALEIAVSVLAAVYSDHPDYRAEWACEQEPSP